MAGLHFDITGDNSNFLKKLEESRNGVRNTSRQIEESGLSIEQLFKRLSTTAAAFGVGLGAKQLVSDITRVRGEFQQLEVAFNTMLGSKEKADILMSQLVDTAAKTPFDLQGVANGAKQLLAYGVAAEDINAILTRLGDIAAGLSIPLGDLVYLYGTTMAQGRLYTADLNQFTGRGIPMIQELAKHFGVAESNVKRMVEDGKVGFPEVQKVIENLTNKGGKFGGLMEAQSKTISGQISNIEDSITNLYNKIGQSSEGVINLALSGVSNLLENYEKVGEAIAVAVTAYGSYKATLMTVTAMQTLNNMVLRQAVVEKGLAAASGISLSNAEAIAAARTKMLTIAQSGLVKALKATAAATIANPYVLMAAAVTSLAYGIYKLSTYESEAEKAQRSLNEAFTDAEKSAISEHRELAKLKGELSALTKGTNEYNSVKDKIINKFGKYYDGLDEEISRVGLTEAAYNKLTDAIEKSHGARQYSRFIKEQESVLDNVEAENLLKIQNRLYDKLGDEEGAKVYRQIRDGIMRGAFGVGKGLHNITGLSGELQKTLDIVAGKEGGFLGLTDRTIEKSISDIIKARKLYDDIDKLARERWNITDVSDENSNGAKTQHTVKDKSYWEEQKKEAEASRDALDVSKVNSKEWQKYTQQIIEAQEQLNKYADHAKQEKISKKALKEYEESAEELLFIRRKNQQDEINLMNDCLEKKIKQAELNYAKEKDAIEKQRNEWKKDGPFTELQNEVLFNAEKVALEQKKKAIEDAYNADVEANDRYLVEYGSFLEKKEAITRQFEKKKEKATTDGDRAMLDRQLKDTLSSLEFEKFQKGINWELVFNDLGKVSKKYMKDLEAQLRGIKTSREYQAMSIDQKKVIEESLNSINNAIIEKGGLLGDLPDQLNNLRIAQEELENAQYAYNKAIMEGTEEQKNTAFERRTLAMKWVQNARTNVNKSTDETTGNLIALSRVIGDLGSNSEMSLSAIGGLATEVINVFSESGSKIGGIVGAILSLLDGIGERGLGGFLDNIFGSVFKAIGGIWNTLTFGLIGVHESDPSLENDIELLTQSNSELKASIDNLSDKMDESPVAEAPDIYDQQMKNISDAMKNTQEMMARSGASYSKGFLGIGGTHSSNKYIDDAMSADEWQRISDITGVSVRNASDFWNLTCEEMALVMNEAADLYAKIKTYANDGHADASKYMDEYVGYYKQMQELEESFQEKITSTSFKNVQSDFENMILDMESSTDDFTGYFEKKMKEAVLKSMMSDVYYKRLKDWYKKFTEAMKDGVLSDKDEKDPLKKEWDTIVQDAIKERDELLSAIGLGVESGQSQSAISRGFGTEMTHEDAGELSGRFTALQVVGEGVKEATLSILSFIQSSSIVTKENNTILSDMRNLMIISNGHLEDISISTKKILNEFMDKLNSIDNNLSKAI